MAMSAVGIVNPDKKYGNDDKPYLFSINIPKMLSLMSFHDPDAYVPGINNIIEGGYVYETADGQTKTALSFEEKKARGLTARNALAEYKKASDAGDKAAMDSTEAVLKENYDSFGYGFLDKPEDSIPNVPLNYYSFRIMVYLCALFMLLFILAVALKWRKWLSIVGIVCVPLAYVMVECGWIVAETGRQPWVVQDLMPANAAVTSASVGGVNTMIIVFAVIFTTILAAMLSITFKTIKQGPEIIK